MRIFLLSFTFSNTLSPISDRGVLRPIITTTTTIISTITSLQVALEPVQLRVRVVGDRGRIGEHAEVHQRLVHVLWQEDDAHVQDDVLHQEGVVEDEDVDEKQPQVKHIWQLLEERLHRIQASVDVFCHRKNNRGNARVFPCGLGRFGFRYPFAVLWKRGKSPVFPKKFFACRAWLEKHAFLSLFPPPPTTTHLYVPHEHVSVCCTIILPTTIAVHMQRIHICGSGSGFAALRFAEAIKTRPRNVREE